MVVQVMELQHQILDAVVAEQAAVEMLALQEVLVLQLVAVLLGQALVLVLVILKGIIYG